MVGCQVGLALTSVLVMIIPALSYTILYRYLQDGCHGWVQDWFSNDMPHMQALPALV